jgi:hypothetical protein
MNNTISRTQMPMDSDVKTGPFIKFVHFKVGYDCFEAEIMSNSTDELFEHVRSYVDRRKLRYGRFYIMFGSKPLLCGKSIEDYGIPNHATLRVEFPQMLGGYQFLPLYTHVLQCELQVCNELSLQSGDTAAEEIPPTGGRARSSPDFAHMFAQLGQRLSAAMGADAEDAVKLVEDILILVHGIMTSTGRADVTMAVVTFAKLRCQGSLLYATFNAKLFRRLDDLLGLHMQSTNEYFSQARQMLDNYAKARDMPIVKKFHKFAMYALSLSLFEKAGISMDNLAYSRMEQECLKQKYHMGPDFFHCVLDTLLFVCERGYQCYISGSLAPFVHSGSRYEEWFDKASELKRKAAFLGNPEEMGFSYHSFVAEIDDAVDEGDQIVKYMSNGDKLESRYVKGMLDSLKMTRGLALSKRAAQKVRNSPFSVLIHGGSCVGKSTVKAILQSHFQKLFDKPAGDEYCYTRNPSDKNWSGFNSAMWCVILDDIAFLRPDAAPAGDPSVLEMLQIINFPPFVTAQADLPDKGRVPMRADLVLVTTNTLHLNADAYFACPLAVQRRFVISVTVAVKAEYRVDNGTFLDSSKVPPQFEGEYPNLWEFTVHKVIPAAGGGDRQMSRHEVIHKFTDINEFLVFFSKAAKVHRTTQKAIDASTGNFRDLEVCKVCMNSKARCVCAPIDLDSQADDVPANAFLWCLARFWAAFGVSYCLWYSIFYLLAAAVCCCRNVVMFHRFVRLFLRGMDYAAATPGQALYVYQQALTLRPTPQIMKRVGLAAGLIIAWWKLSGYLVPKMDEPIVDTVVKPVIVTRRSDEGSVHKLPSEDEGEDCVDAEATLVVQGNVLPDPVGIVPEPDVDGRVNVWYKEDYETTTFDTSEATRSSLGLSHHQMEEIVARNCVFLKSRLENGKMRLARAVCVGGHTYVTDNHCFPDTDTFQLTVIQASNVDGVVPNVTFVVDQRDIKRFPHQEIAFLCIRNLPPKKNITKYFHEPTFRGVHSGLYIMRNLEGGIKKMNVDNIHMQLATVASLEEPLDVWWGSVPKDTCQGDCGAVLVTHSPVGFVILGIHLLGGKMNCVGANPLTRPFVQRVLQELEPLCVQAGEPMLSAPTAPRTLVELHKKSPIRFIENGQAAVYGSFVGFRAATKSRVRATMLADALGKRGYKINAYPPVLQGYMPWRNGLLDMTNPVSKMNPAILRACADSYYNDIMRAIPAEELAKVKVYDVDVAINGAAGVAYVDKMKRTTSMGAPWNKSKKYCMTRGSPRNGLQDPADVNDEVMERVAHILNEYRAGRRVYPVFTGHLKDEALPKRKIDSQKTRIFTGSPIDWSIVVRMYYLSIIRLVQNNRYVFEAAVGTIAQSKEWNQMREYLVQHGTNQMVAGDYRAFDKTMSSLVILYSFHVMICIARMAGYSEEDLLVMQCIAEDTAFPLTDFNGDLIEFYGSNPSGHPLTVIINCFANSLYMRYAFATLYSVSMLCSFQTLVALMTYGDDNVMGVSKEAPQFNHVNIQHALGEVGITYTMPDKEAESVPYVSIDEVSFLKRTWRYDDELNCFVAPLEEASIEKMLMVGVSSKTVCAQTQAVDVVNSAVREYFWYGSSVFNDKREMLMEITEESGLQAYVTEATFPSWHHLKKEFNSVPVTSIDFTAGKRC